MSSPNTESTSPEETADGGQPAVPLTPESDRFAEATYRGYLSQWQDLDSETYHGFTTLAEATQEAWRKAATAVLALADKERD